LKDRTPTYPGRVTLTPVPGQNNTYDMVRADSPIEEGTPINKQTLLTDETAKLLELKQTDPTVENAFEQIAKNFTGDMGINTNLLKEAINMKYCKVLTLEDTTADISAFYANACVQTGYESDDGKIQVLACIDMNAGSQLKIRIINKNTNATFNSVVPLYADVYGRVVNSNYFVAPGSGLAADFNGWFHVCPVKNRPNEVMLKLCGDLHRYDSYSSNSYYYTNRMRLVHILDVTTGAIKAHAFAYYADATSNYIFSNNFNLGMGNNDYCYYNATYGYYYTPLTYTLTSSYYNAGQLFYIKSGCNYEVNTYSSFNNSPNCGFISSLAYNSYIGCTCIDSEYTGQGFSWYMPISDTRGISFTYDSYYSGYMYVYSVTQSSYNSFSKSTLYSSSSFYAFAQNTYWSYNPSSAYGLRIYVLATSDNKLYMFAPGQRHSSHSGYSTNEYYCLMRFGPFSLNSSSSNPPVATVVKGIPNSVNNGYRFYNMIGCKDGNPNKPIFAMIPFDSNSQGGHGGTVMSLAQGESGTSYKVMMPSVMAGIYGTSNTAAYYRYDGDSNPWRSGNTFATCWYNNHLTKMFMCSVTRDVYLGDFVSSLTRDTDGIWTCPEDGTYKIILVGGGANGGTGYGGGSGYLKIGTLACEEDDEIPYHIGRGGYYSAASNPYLAEEGSRETWFGSVAFSAKGGAGYRGGANGYRSSGSGGGGGYDLVEYGGNGQPANIAPSRNGGQGTVPAIGYGAGGCAASSGSDGVIVIIR